MEVLDVYNKNNQKTGKTIIRGDRNLNSAEYIKLATLWVKCKNRFLIQKCSKEKGGEYAVSGGHVSSGNDSLQQIIIEIKEELNIDINKTKINFLGSLFHSHAIFDVYLYEDDNFPINSISLQKSEVESISWLTIDEIKELINRNLFRNSSRLQLEEYFEML